MKPTIRAFFVPLIVVLLAGCGTVLHGTKQKITLQSEPSGAHVTIGESIRNPSHTGSTPLTVNIRRERRYIVHFSKTGYIEKTGIFRQELTTGGMLSLFPGSLLLFPPVIDVTTGAMYRNSHLDTGEEQGENDSISKNTFNVQLKKGK